MLQDIETNSPHQKEIIKQEYNRPTEKHYKDSPELKTEISTSKALHKLLPKETDLNETLKLIQRKNGKVPISLCQSKKYRQDILLAPILRIYVYTYYKINYVLLRMQYGK